MDQSLRRPGLFLTIKYLGQLVSHFNYIFSSINQDCTRMIRVDNDFIIAGLTKIYPECNLVLD